MAHVNWMQGERRQMKVRGGQGEGHRSETAREKGQTREVKQWQKGKRKSMQSLINSNSLRLHGGLSLQSSPPPTSIFPSHICPSLFWSFCALLLPFPIFLFVPPSHSPLSIPPCISTPRFQLCPLNPLIFSLSDTFDFSHPSTPSRTYCKFSPCASSLSFKYCAVKWIEIARCSRMTWWGCGKQGCILTTDRY